VRLVVAGDGERFAAIERLTRRLGLADRVVLAGRCAREQVRSWLGAARALVVPSTYEGMPLVILEAMELGIPIVASGVSGIPEVVVDGDTGWVVPAEDVGALTEALRAVWCDGAEAARRGASGCRRLDAAYRPHHAAENWLAAVHEAQDASGAR
jgi:glycosyltransferase involved in cell wall biosynthesis